MTAIQDIMQVGVGVPDRERFENFARNLLGFTASQSPDGRVTYLRPDQYSHRIAAYTAPQPALQYIGLDVGGHQQLAEWETKLTAEGIDWRRSSPKERAERRVTDFIEFNDPDGHALALSYGFEVDKDPVRYTRDLSVLRLGHVLLTVADTQRSHGFYTGVLGFRLSDWINIDDHIRLCFLRCNERHHSMASCPRIISCAYARRPLVWAPAATSTVRPSTFTCKHPADLASNSAGASAVSMMRISRSSIQWGVPSICGAVTSRARNSSLDRGEVVSFRRRITSMSQTERLLKKACRVLRLSQSPGKRKKSDFCATILIALDGFGM